MLIHFGADDRFTVGLPALRMGGCAVPTPWWPVDGWDRADAAQPTVVLLIHGFHHHHLHLLHLLFLSLHRTERESGECPQGWAGSVGGVCRERERERERGNLLRVCAGKRRPRPTPKRTTRAGGHRSAGQSAAQFGTGRSSFSSASSSSRSSSRSSSSSSFFFHHHHRRRRFFFADRIFLVDFYFFFIVDERK